VLVHCLVLARVPAHPNGIGRENDGESASGTMAQVALAGTILE